MPYYEFLWTDQIIEHLAEHDITPTDFKRVLCNAIRHDTSPTTGRPRAYGYTHDGRFVVAVYETIDKLMVLPVTAYEI